MFVHHCSMTLGSLVGNCHTKNQKLPKPYLLLKINVIYLHKDLPVQQTFEENKTTPTCVKVSEINEPFTAFLIKSKHFLKFPLPYFSMLPELSTRNPMSILVLHSMQRQKHDKYQYFFLLYKLRCYTRISSPEKSRNNTREKIRYFVHVCLISPIRY